MVALVLPRAGTHAALLAPGAGLGALLFLFVLVTGGPGLGPSLWLAGGTYVTFLAAWHPRIDAAAPLVAVLLLLAGELAAWSADERRRMQTDPALRWRRAGAVGVLALGGIALSTLAVVLTVVPAAHNLASTVAGAAAAVAAAGTAIHHARR